jgi:hypothetical protein
MQINAADPKVVNWVGMWQPIRTAPFDRDLQLAVLDTEGAHALVFPCRRVLRGWVEAQTLRTVDVHPTHWRAWDDTANSSAYPLAS